MAIFPPMWEEMMVCEMRQFCFGGGTTTHRSGLSCMHRSRLNYDLVPTHVLEKIDYHQISYLCKI